MIEQIYRIDMIPNGAPVVVHVSQYDTAARRLSFELYNGGVAYELPAGAVASIAGTKPDNTSFLYAMTVSGNLVSIDLQQQMALVAGDVPAEIQITGAEGKIGSANFIIRVERGPIDENSVISETDLPIFEQLVSDAQEAASDAQTAADTASTAASSVASIVPASPGTAGQVLTKTATGADWQDVDGLPAGGTAGQVLTKNSSTDGDASWATMDLSAKVNASTLATVETGTTASKAYAVGEYLVYNGILYRVTAAISSGQTLVPGTNITDTTAGAELTSLNNGLFTLHSASATTTLKTIMSFWRVGGTVYVTHDAVMNLPAANTEYVIAIIPSGYAPTVSFYTSCVLVNNWNIVGTARIRFMTNGSVKILSSISGAQEYRFSAVYFTRVA